MIVSGTDVHTQTHCCALVRRVLAAAPVVHHVAVRESFQSRNILIREAKLDSTDRAP